MSPKRLDWKTTRFTQERRTLLERFGKSVDNAQSQPELLRDFPAAEPRSRKMPNRVDAS